MTSGMTLVMAGHMDFWYRMVELCFYLNVILPIAGTRWSGQENWRRDLPAAHVSQEDKHLRISLTSDTTTHSETKFEFGPHCMHTVTAPCRQSGAQGSRDPSVDWPYRLEHGIAAGKGRGRQAGWYRFMFHFFSISMRCHPLVTWMY